MQPKCVDLKTQLQIFDDKFINWRTLDAILTFENNENKIK